MDVGEQFYNFPLHPELQLYSGVDLTPLLELPGTSCIEVWKRCVMGQKPSPFQAVRDTRRAKYASLRDPTALNNVFGWDKVVLNFPGSAHYCPSEPWISQRTRDGHIAPDVIDYVDDNRGTAHGYETTWRTR